MENKFKCTYPGCKKEGCYKQAFELINEEGASVELAFCQYHHIIVVGGHFKAEIIKEHQNLLGDKKELDFKLIGPFHEVEIVEQVMGAREIVFLKKDQECFICGKTNLNKEIHHIDGDKENNKLSNLLSICKKCHAFIHHPEGINKWKIKPEVKLLLEKYTNIWFKSKKKTEK